MERQEEKPLVFGIYRFKEEKLLLRANPYHLILGSILFGAVILILHILYPLL